MICFGLYFEHFQFDIATQGGEKMICLGSLCLRWRFCQTNILFQWFVTLLRSFVFDKLSWFGRQKELYRWWLNTKYHLHHLCLWRVACLTKVKIQLLLSIFPFAMVMPSNDFILIYMRLLFYRIVKNQNSFFWTHLFHSCNLLFFIHHVSWVLKYWDKRNLL